MMQVGEVLENLSEKYDPPDADYAAGYPTPNSLMMEEITQLKPLANISLSGGDAFRVRDYFERGDGNPSVPPDPELKNLESVEAFIRTSRQSDTKI